MTTRKRGRRGDGSIRPRGKESWELRFPVNGKMRSITFRGTKADARKELRALVAKVDQNALPEPSKVTVAHYVSERIGVWEVTGRKNKGPISAKTAERYRELLENQIRPHIGGLPVQKIDTTDIEAWHVTLKTNGRKDGQGGLAPRTVLHAHRLLSEALDDAGRHNIATRNVAAVQSAPAVEDEEIAILTEGQIRTLLTKLQGRVMYAPVVTDLFTGLRRGELLALRWSHIDIENKGAFIREALEETKVHGIRVKETKTKSGRREIALPDIVVDTLREHRRQQLELRMALGLGKLPDDALLFPTIEGEHKSPRAFSAAWAKLANILGMGDVTFHALRHTHASQLIDAGIDVVTISRRLGHANPNITLKVYAHLFRKRDDKAADAINAALAGFGQA